LLLTTGDHGRVHAALQPAIDRFFALDEDEQDGLRDALNRFVRIYSFLSQVVGFTDTKLERDYLFCKALSSFLKPSTATGMDLGPQVELMALRMEKTFEGELSLTAAQGEQTTIFSDTGKQQQLELGPLSLIITQLNETQLNERFGTDWALEKISPSSSSIGRFAPRPAVMAPGRRATITSRSARSPGLGWSRGIPPRPPEASQRLSLGAVPASGRSYLVLLCI